MFDFDFPILYALEKLRSPFLDAVMGGVTYLGHELVFMVVAIILYWCVSKKWGYYLLCVGYFGTLANQFAKILCRVPRPWVMDPGFTIVENARAAASGYSFPSGHAAGIVGTMGCVARISKKTWVRIVCIAVILIVGFSRLYLGVHYPSDVLFSLIVGAVIVFAAYPFFVNADQKPQLIYVAVGVLGVLGLAFVLYMQLHVFPADTDPVNHSEAIKNSWSLFGGVLGMLPGLWLDSKYIHFDVKARWWAQVLKCVLGLALLLAIKEGLKPVLGAVFGDALFTNAIRYFVTVFFAAAVWPLTFRWFAGLGKRAK